MSLAHDTAWAAGFVDGEGWITIQRRSTKINNKVYNGHYLRIGVNHVAPEPLHELQRIFGGKLRLSTRVVGNRKPRWTWTLSTASAAEALKRMMPYFKNKQQVAALGLDFQSTIQTHKHAVTIELYKTRENFKEQITRLNSLD